MSSAEVHFQAILDELGWSGDPEMARTAERFISVLKLHQAPTERFDFSVCAGESRVPVIARDIPMYSLCAHHLLPFLGTATIAYEPDGKLVGLGALPRLVQHFARRPQIQERLTEQIAHQLFVEVAPKAVVVKISARHMCVEMRSELAPQSVDTVVVLGEPGPALRALL